jgi:hypothetical protein
MIKIKLKIIIKTVKLAVKNLQGEPIIIHS